MSMARNEISDYMSALKRFNIIECWGQYMGYPKHKFDLGIMWVQP